MNKKLGFDELIGKRLLSPSAWENGDKSWLLHTDAGDYRLEIEDDGCNDSNAFLSDVSGLDEVKGKIIARVEEDSDAYGAEVKLHTSAGKTCVINITHEQNGYYGFCYELILCPNKVDMAKREP
jgi:hypothetical protein